MFDILSGAAAYPWCFSSCVGSPIAHPYGARQQFLPFQANGSLIKDDHGAVLGSRLIGQQWNDPQWFMDDRRRPRPPTPMIRQRRYRAL